MDDLNPKNLESFDKIETVDLQVEMARSYLDYAMSVSYTHLTLPTIYSV